MNHNIDIIALCEADSDNCPIHGFHPVEHIEKNKDIAVYIRDEIKIYYTREQKRYCLLRIENGYDINLAIAHLNSDLHSSGAGYREADINGIKKYLQIEEEKYNNKNTLILGDFNEEPFSERMTRWLGFNSVFFKSSIGQGYLSRHEEEQDVFYNPMLHVIRDSDSEEVAKGTYYHESEKAQYFYDQVLMKKSLAMRFNFDKLRIISSFDDVPLVKNHKPIPDISDHVPIYFEISSAEV